MKKKLKYETPIVDNIEVQVEKEFAASEVEGNPGGTGGDLPWG